MSTITQDELITQLKREIREEQAPFFEDDDFAYYLTKHNNDVDATAYEMLILKSEDSTISVSGLSTQDTSSYFKRLASMHRKFNSGTLGG